MRLAKVLSVLVQESEGPALEEFENLYYRQLKTIELFGMIEVELAGSGSAEKIGLTESELTDYMKLKFRNTFTGVKYKDFRALALEKLSGTGIIPEATKVPKVVVRILPQVFDNEDPKKFGEITCRVWTVGDNYPVAYHIKCEAGRFDKPHIWQKEILGIGSERDAQDEVRRTLGKVIEDFAVVFFKARHEM